MRSLPCAQVVEFLSFFGDGSTEVDALQALMSDAVLDVYAQWHMPGGRLVCQRPSGATYVALQGAKNVAFRLPFDALLAVARYAQKHIKAMRSGDGVVSIPDPGGHRDRPALADAAASSSLVTKAMCYLREMPGCATVADDPMVEQAYRHTVHELGAFVGRNAQPLDNKLRAAIVRECGDLTELSDARLVTWTVLAPMLMQRTCEGLSLMHGDLVIRPGASDGSWYVPGWTKNTDGIEGRVPLWSHRPGCQLAGCCLHEALEKPIDELRCAACSADSDGRLALELACPVCLVWYQRKLQGLSASQADSVHPLYQEIDNQTMMAASATTAAWWISTCSSGNCAPRCYSPTLRSRQKGWMHFQRKGVQRTWRAMVASSSICSWDSLSSGWPHGHASQSRHC